MTENKDVVLPESMNDMRDISEDGRITAIGEAASKHAVSVLLEKDEPEKITRYIKRVTDQFPNVEHVETVDSIAPSIASVRFRPKPTPRADMAVPTDFPAPTLESEHAKIFDITEAAIAYATEKGEEDSSVRLWFIFAPWMHLAWAWHYVALIHLRGMVGGRNTILKFPEATHEFVVFSMNPDVPPNVQKPSLLSPVSILQQFKAVSDAEALQRIEAQFPAILAGELSVDSDFRNAWRILLASGHS